MIGVTFTGHGVLSYQQRLFRQALPFGTSHSWLYVLDAD
jgi:hypothetical protein